MGVGTHEGDAAEKDFVARFNENKDDADFDEYLVALNYWPDDPVYMVRVTTKQYSSLADHKVMTRADSYLIYSEDERLSDILDDENYYLDENILADENIKYDPVDNSGVSIKMTDSISYQILKLTPDSFNKLFDEYELGAAASVYCKNKNELVKNDAVFAGWNTTRQDIIDAFVDEIPELDRLNDDIDLDEELDIYYELKSFANEEITRRIEDDEKLQGKIFNGFGIYEEPYTAPFFYHGEEIKTLTFIPFYVTTGSGRSKGNYTLVLKPRGTEY